MDFRFDFVLADELDSFGANRLVRWPSMSRCLMMPATGFESRFVETAAAWIQKTRTMRTMTRTSTSIQAEGNLNIPWVLFNYLEFIDEYFLK